MEPKYILHIVSHTHWDREWYLSFQVFRRKFVKMMDRLIDLFDKNGFKYFMLDGQTLILKDYLEIRPEKREKIKELVREGKLLIGPWFSQPNEFLVSGEALIRNLMLGFRHCKEYGKRMNVCYIPDGFGHISQLPLIMKGFGMNDAVAWRGLPKGSRTVFAWKGADGTECTVSYMFGTYGNAVSLPLSVDAYAERIDSTSFIRKGLMERMNEIISSLSERSAGKNLLLMNGIDHSFAQEDLPEVIGKIICLYPDFDVFHSTLEEYILSVKDEIAKNGTKLDTAEGELRDPTEVCILPGSQSTRTDVKISNSRIEGLLEKWTEPFSCAAWMAGYDHPHADIWRSWEYLLENHAHDSLACSSTDHAYHQVMTRSEWAEEIAEDISRESLQRICRQVRMNDLDNEKEAVLVVFNPLGWKRSEAVTAVLDVPKALRIPDLSITDGGTPVYMKIHSIKEAQILKFNPKNGAVDLIPVNRYSVTFLAENIPASGYKAFKLRSGRNPAHSKYPLKISDSDAENEYVSIKINNNGTLDLFDKRTGQSYNGLHYFEDSGEAGDGFVHAAPANDTVINSLGCSCRVSLVEKTDIKAIFRVELEMSLPENLTEDRKERGSRYAPCTMISHITISAGTPRIDIKTTAANRSGGHRLRVVFPSGIKAERSYAEQPFDIVFRKIDVPVLDKSPEGFEEAPSPTHPQLSFAGVTDSGKGLMIANRGLYEYELKDNENRDIAVTLLRCVDLIYEPYLGHADEGLIPEAQCLGDHEFSYSIIPHKGGWENAYRDAYESRFPLKAVIRRSLEEEVMPDWNMEGKTDLPDEHSFISLGDPSLILSSMKKCEDRDSVIIRVFNLTENRVETWLKASYPDNLLTGAYTVDLCESRKEKLQFDKDGSVNITVGKKAVFTAELIFERREK